ncbi:hypothetical protein HDV00_012250 [Rhizophlyctis rosea]|nr:hypothetical protein HDV00_012250 [Rhizophlyctis rosea]
MDQRRKLKQDHLRRTRGAGAAKMAAKKVEIGRRIKVKKQYRKLLQHEAEPSQSSYLDETDDAPSFYVPDVPQPDEEEAAVEKTETPGEEVESDGDDEHIQPAGEGRGANWAGAKMNKVKGGRVQKQSSKPNPFAKAASKAAREKAEREAAIEEARCQKEEANQKRKEYYSQRNKTRSKLQQRTKKGQPVMANQISHMLDKIKTSM